MRLDFYFDFSCPYAYIASTQIAEIAARTGAELRWRPMLLGGVFQAIGAGGGPMATMGAAKARHNGLDMQRWAEHAGVALRVPPGHPNRTVAALRALLALPEERWPVAIHALFRAYWVKAHDLSDPAVIGAALAEAGLGAPEVERALSANDDPTIKNELRARTQEAVGRGVFGAPTMFAGEGQDAIMFWGQDRLPFVEAALGGWRPAPVPLSTELPPRPQPANGPRRIEFWYDFSSPFSYLGSTQIEAIAARAGASLSWKPMLLGAVFKQIGTPDVPMLATSESKRRYHARELELWSAHWQVPFRFASRFPMKTVTALRLALLAGDRIAPLSHALYRALWVDDRDLDDAATLTDILERQGLDAAAMLARTREPAVKQQLIDNTAAAVERGIFGAPTCIVTHEEGDMLFWGQDRLAMVERAAAGWRPACG